MVVYSHTPIIPKTLHTVTRVLPGQGRVFTKVGQEVAPHDIVGEGKKQSGFRSFSLPELLKISDKEAKNALRKVIGSSVFEGEILAEVDKFLGLKKIQFRAPQEGILRSFDEERGLLTFEYPPKLIRVPAGVSGIVSAIIPKKEVSIESVVAKIKARLSAGKVREGTLTVLCPPDIPLSPDILDSTLSGKIVIGGSEVTKEVLYKALAVRCNGIIAGGISWRDFWEVTGERGAAEDVGLTLLITEGFGRLNMAKEVFDFLKENEGRYCILDGGSTSAIVPLSLPGGVSESPEALAGKGVKGVKREEEDGRFGVLEKGLRVRILVPPRMHQFGKIVEISEEKAELSSGIFAQTCKVRVGEEVVEVPVRNIEIIET